MLDAGCGEGKNAAFLSTLGAQVDAFDLSAAAIANARQAWPPRPGLTYAVADARHHAWSPGNYDLVIAYGLLHCLASPGEIEDVIARLQRATRLHGHAIVCVFNDRVQDLAAHPGFAPTLMSHAWYLDHFASWTLESATDQDLWETHPHNNIRHCHSMTRLIARKAAP
ncbi:MAG: class I SAM-dependent methyltransferase [Myxococcales bacterium]|nr:class I SAM-dependent methyltransferase [Myxococcales bacterium]